MLIAAALLAAVVLLWTIGVVRRLGALAAALAATHDVLRRAADQRRATAEVIAGCAATAMTDEQETLIATARAARGHQAACEAAQARPGGAGEIAALAGAEAKLQAALARLLALAEAYPELKADARMASSVAQLAALAPGWQAARQAFNQAAREYNAAVQMWPARLVALAMRRHDAGLLPEERPRT